MRRQRLSTDRVRLSLVIFVYWRASDMLLTGQTKTKIAFFGKYITYSSFRL
jgi:hypothetical protein